MIDSSDLLPWQVQAGVKARILDASAVKSWAAKAVGVETDDRAFFILKDILTAKDANSLEVSLAALVSDEREQRPTAEQFDTFIRDLWFGMLRAYADGDMAPHRLCQTVPAIEEMCDYPDWLGRIYHACDWVTEQYARSDAPEVEREARRLLESQVDGLNPPLDPTVKNA